MKNKIPFLLATIVFTFFQSAYAQLTINNGNGPHELLNCPGVVFQYYIVGGGCFYTWEITNGRFAPTGNTGVISADGKRLTGATSGEVSVIWDNVSSTRSGDFWTAPQGVLNVTQECVVNNSPVFRTGQKKAWIRTLNNVQPKQINAKDSETVPFCSTSLTLTVPSIPYASTGGPAPNFASTSPQYVPQYEWTIPAGWSGPNGATGTFRTTTNAITITNNGCAGGGTVTVAGVSSCGTTYKSLTRSLTINRSPANLAVTTDPAGYNTAVCGVRTPVTFSTATTLPCGGTFTWTLPAGWSPNSGTGTSITATPSGTSADAGNATVSTTLTCGRVITGTVAVGYNPSNPPTVPTFTAASSILCNSSSGTYTVTSTNGPTSYSWEVTGGLLINGATTATNTTGSVVVTAPSTGSQQGEVRVTASSVCGTSAVRIYPVWIGNVGGTDGILVEGNVNPAIGGTYQYKLSRIPTGKGTITYRWRIPAGNGWAFYSTNTNSPSVYITVGSTAGSVEAYWRNECAGAPTRFPLSYPGETGTYLRVTPGNGGPGPAPLRRSFSAAGEAAGQAVEVFPNPFENTFTVYPDPAQRGELTLALVDPVGRVYYQEKKAASGGDAGIAVDVSDKPLKPGIYFLKITDADSKTSVVKLVKQ